MKYLGDRPPLMRLMESHGNAHVRVRPAPLYPERVGQSVEIVRNDGTRRGPLPPGEGPRMEN